jgi:hypothetical protein
MGEDMTEHNGIEATRLYTFAEAASLLPSVYRGKHVSIKTLHSWRQRGKVQALERSVKGKRCYLILGSELLKVLAARKDCTP